MTAAQHLILWYKGASWKYSVTNYKVVSCLWKYFPVWKYRMVVIWRKALTDEKKSDASCMLWQSRLGTHSEPKTNNSSAPQALGRYAQTLCRTAGQKKKKKSKHIFMGADNYASLHSAQSSIFHRWLDGFLTHGWFIPRFNYKLFHLASYTFSSCIS